MLKTLKTEWAVAIPKREIGASKTDGWKTALIRQKTTSQTVVPITLNSKWTVAACFAFLFAPTEEIIAVAQVPIFCPIIMGMAAP